MVMLDEVMRTFVYGSYLHKYMYEKNIVLFPGKIISAEFHMRPLVNNFLFFPLP
jgi:hypothetical protein